MNQTDARYHSVLVDSDALREHAHRIRRDCFAVESDADNATVQDQYEYQANSRTHLLLNGTDVPVGTIRLCVYSAAHAWQRIPAFDLFPDLIDTHLGRGATMVQSTYFAVSPGHHSPCMIPKLLLIREFIRSAVVHQAVHAITIVRNIPTRVRFFARLGFRPIGAPRLHPWALKEVVLIRVHPLDALRLARSNARLSPIGSFDEFDVGNSMRE